jgi:hypothetical protein
MSIVSLGGRRAFGPVSCAAGLLVLVTFILAGCGGEAEPAASGEHDHAAGHARPRPEIPDDWPKGKRIVMHVTPSLKQSYVVACDLPIPAWNYQHHGHYVTIALDSDAVTALRRDGSGKTPLDRLEILKEDLDELRDYLNAPLDASPKNYGELFRYLSSHGVGFVANGDALRARNIQPSEMDPMVTVVSGPDFKKLLSDVDAMLPFDDLAVPHHPLFHQGQH